MRSQRSSRKCLIITTIAFSLVALVGLMPALTSFFLFDAPGSEKNPATILLFCSALTLPVVCLVCIALSWIVYARKHFTAACWISFVPTLNLICAAGALLWLELFNGGRFS
jgi:hypothetical protein